MPSFTNQASLSYNDIVTNSNIVVGNIVETLSVTKSAVTDTYFTNYRVTYVVTVVNSGNVSYSQLTLNDNLGAYTYSGTTVVPLTYTDDSILLYINGVLQPTPGIDTSNGLTISGVNVGPNSSAVIVYQTTVNNYAPLGIGDSITNTVTLTGAGLSDPITAEETIVPLNSAQLAISKSLSPSTVSENSQITYTFVIQNTGNTSTASTDNLTVTDVFDPVLENITVTYNGDVLTPGVDYTYTNGVFTTVNGVISVPAATFAQSADGTWTIDPGIAVITVTGTV